MNIALVLSGGIGCRVGGSIPKQYIKVGKRSILSYCIKQLSDHEEIDGIWIVAEALWREEILECLKLADKNNKFMGFSNPGKTRQLSVYHGLEDIRSFAHERDLVLIHDAARPLLSAKMITDCFSAVAGHDGVIPVLPMKDTLYCSQDGVTIASLLNRDKIYAGQAPEIFYLESYYRANRNLLPEQILLINGSTEPAVMAGMDIVMIPGDENNFKITTRADLERFCRIVLEEEQS